MTEENKSPAKINKPSKMPLLIGFLALLLAIASAGTAGYLWVELHRLQTDNTNNFSQITSRIFDQQNHLKVIQESANAALESSSFLEKESEDLASRIQNITEELSSVTGLNRVDWQISHAEHLARAAHQRLVLTNDIDGAYALLDAADKIMADVKELGVIDVRRSMAQDLMTLKVTNKVDVVGLFEKLDALKAHIMKLSLPPQDWTADEIKTKEIPANADLQTKVAVVMDNAWQMFNSQYQTQQLDEPIKPILSTEQRSYLKQNLNLLMEQAQLAVIKRDPIVFQRIILQAETWVVEHFRLDTPVGEVVLESLMDMKTIELNPTAPDITATIRSLKTFSVNWEKEKQIRQQGAVISESKKAETTDSEASKAGASSKQKAPADETTPKENNSDSQELKQEVPKV